MEVGFCFGLAQVLIKASEPTSNHPIPVVYGLTIGKYANMINGEGWLSTGIKCDLRVIPCKKSDYTMPYRLPVTPSPGIIGLNTALLYPSTIFF